MSSKPTGVIYIFICIIILKLIIKFYIKKLLSTSKKEPNEENYKRLLRIVKGISEDLQDILYRQNIESYRVEGHEVDVRRQKIIQTVPTNEQAKDNLVAVRAADGYEKNGKVLRAERIKIFKYTTETTGDSAEN